jgi:hypothetical protein
VLSMPQQKQQDGGLRPPEMPMPQGGTPQGGAPQSPLPYRGMGMGQLLGQGMNETAQGMGLRPPEPMPGGGQPSMPPQAQGAPLGMGQGMPPQQMLRPPEMPPQAQGSPMQGRMQQLAQNPRMQQFMQSPQFARIAQMLMGRGRR